MSFISRIFPTRTPSSPPIILDAALVHSEGEYADFDCIQAVVNYVNTAQSRAFFKPEELSPAAPEIYEVDRYLAQVNNGGHGQYWHNCGRALDEMAPFVEAGFRAIKAKKHLRVFRHFVKEMRGQEPAAEYEVSRKMSSHFSILDDEFFRIEKSEPVAPMQATRIRALKDAVIVERSALEAAFDEMAQANPAFEARRKVADAARTAFWFTNRQVFTAGLAVAAADPPDLFAGLSGGGRMVDVDGQMGYLFAAETLKGQAIVIFHEAYCFVHEKLSVDEINAERARREAGDVPQGDDPDVHDRLWATDGAGRRAVAIPVPEAEFIMARVAELDMGLAAHELLSRAGMSGPVTHAGCLSTHQEVRDKGEVAVLIRADAEMMMVVSDADGAALWTHDARRQLSEISAAELAACAEALREA